MRQAETDQPVHLLSLIRVFIRRSVSSQAHKTATTVQTTRMRRLICVFAASTRQDVSFILVYGQWKLYSICNSKKITLQSAEDNNIVRYPAIFVTERRLLDK